MMRTVFSLAFGLPFLGFGVLALVLFAKATTLECDRIEPKQIECTLVSEGVLGSDTQTISSGQLQGAEIEVNYDSDGDTYRVLLLTDTDPIPFTTVYSSGRSGKQEKVQQINAYLTNEHQKTLTIQQDDRMFGYILGGVFGTVGLVSMGSVLFRW
ncbi:MAG: hypothetical protein VKJ64_10435 [Leptolyngbyaceae bacterium]|nr:hypothetical protein [Leptolyngbyaceae bacterium]